MKPITRVLLLALCLTPGGGAIAAVPSTLGSNLTAYNGASGATNNNNWNNLMNNRTAPAAADFGNCNAVILRCAQPKCANGGCSSMDVAQPIVTGCVQSNDACKQYGDDLVQYISAQLVASSTAKANEQAAAAQTAAAQAAAAQSAQQMQQMQQQMQQIQSEMAAQNAQTVAQLQSALEEQKQLTAQAIADATAAQSAQVAAPAQAATDQTTTTLNDAQITAANNGVSADVLAREQISGQILSSIENAEAAMKNLKTVMQNTFDYAGCDSNGNNCTGPKRVKIFKERALEFFEPYETVLDEIYDALIMAQSVGVDITDIYMMLNGTCNAWAQYLCSEGQVMYYDNTNCQNGRSVPVSSGTASVLGGAQCTIGQVVPMSDGGCQLIKMMTDKDEIQRNWLYAQDGDNGMSVRVGCASEALDNSTLFRNRKKESTIDIDTLKRIIAQDAPSVFGGNRFAQSLKPDPDGVKFCSINASSFTDLQKAVSLKQLPDKVCVKDAQLESLYKSDGKLAEGTAANAQNSVFTKCESQPNGIKYNECLCKNSTSKNANWNTTESKCECVGSTTYTEFDFDRALCVDKNGNSQEDTKYLNYVDDGGFRKDFCNDYGATWNSSTKTCDCSKLTDSVKRTACETMTSEASTTSTFTTSKLNVTGTGIFNTTGLFNTTGGLGGIGATIGGK